MISAPKHLSLAYDDVLDNPKRWEVEMRPPAFSVLAFQRQLDRITGVSGAVKLVWCPDWKVFKSRRVMENVTEQTTPAQSALTDTLGRSVAPPRWMLVERVEPEQYVPDWNNNRWFSDPRDGYQYDLRGPCPSEYFRWYMTIAAHDRLCCEQRHSSNFVCWGYYKHPGEQELAKVARDWRKTLADPVDPHAPAVAIRETQHERDSATEMQHAREGKKEDNRLRAKDALSVYQPSELGQLLAAAKERYVVTAPGKQIHNTVEKIWEKERKDVVRNFDS